MKHFLLILAVLISSQAFPQNQSGGERMAKLLLKSGVLDKNLPEDNPVARIEFDRLKFSDPFTGEIPAGIREKELQYFKRQLQVPSGRGMQTDNLNGWQNRGPYNVGGRTRALAIDVSNENVILAGGVSGGVWRSADGGQTWAKTTGSNELQSVSAIAQDTRTGQTSTWYYTTGEWNGNSASGSGAFFYGDGVYKSTDGGLTWNQLTATSSDEPEVFNCWDISNEIVVNPSNGHVLVANVCGLYRSSNGGTTWSQVYDNADEFGWSEIDVDSQGNYYAFLESDGVFKSTDGTTWTNISSGLPTFSSGERGELAMATSNENLVYLLAETASKSSGYGLWVYNVTSQTWTDRSASIPQEAGQTGNFDSQGGYDLLLAVKPDDANFVIIGGTNLYRSTDGFATTTNTDWIGGYTPANDSYASYTNHHPDQHSFVFYRSDPKKVISGNDGGLQYAPDITATAGSVFPIIWTPLNNGYLTTQVYALSIGPGNQIMAGFQDNGTWLTTSTQTEVEWTSPFGGDGAYSAFNSTGTQRYVSSQNGNVYRFVYSSADDTSLDEWANFTPDGYNSALFIAPFYLDTEDDNIFYLGGAANLFVNTQAGSGTNAVGWKTISLPGVSGVISEFGVVGAGTTYLGTSTGKLYKVSNAQSGSPTVSNVTGSNFPSGYISGIDANGDNEIVVSFSNYSIQSIYYSADGGATWTAVSGNLEENANGSGSGPSVRSVRILGDGELYLAGTSTGLFTTTSINGASTQWAQEDVNNLGAVVIEHLVARDEDGLVVVGTHGNGVYSATKPVSANDLKLSSINAPKSGVLGTEQVSVTVINLGSSSQASFTLKYSVNGTEQQSTVVNTSLVPGASHTHTFSTTYDFGNEGDYTILAEALLTGDENTSNNTLSTTVSVFSVLSSYPYSESFEADDHGWTSSGLWELGTPAQELLDGASDGTRAWATDLDADYPNGVYETLTSPVFDFSSLSNPVVSFDINYDIEAEWDGAVFAYRTDLQADFTIVSGEYGLDNWYDGLVDVLGVPAWNGTSNGYKRASADLSFLAGESMVQFAMVMVTDQFVAGEGVAFDHFEISEDDGGEVIFTLTNNTIAENNEVDDLIGNFQLVTGGTATFSFIAGVGSTDNALFKVDGTQLLAGAAFDFESKNTYSIRIRSTDASSVTSDTKFTISVSDENDLPTGFELSNSEISENEEPEALIGSLEALDQDASDSHTFALVDGEGSADNSSFAIEGINLMAPEAFDFETKASYSLRVRVTDSEGEFLRMPWRSRS